MKVKDAVTFLGVSAVLFCLSWIALSRMIMPVNVNEVAVLDGRDKITITPGNGHMPAKTAITNNGYILIEVQNSKEARAMIQQRRQQRSSGEQMLVPASYGNVMDNPQGFSKELRYPLAFNWDGDLTFLVSDGSKYKLEHSVPPENPLYLLCLQK